MTSMTNGANSTSEKVEMGIYRLARVLSLSEYRPWARMIPETNLPCAGSSAPGERDQASNNRTVGWTARRSLSYATAEEKHRTSSIEVQGPERRQLPFDRICQTYCHELQTLGDP